MKFEIDFLPVGEGNADAICVRHDAPFLSTVHVIDGGYSSTSETIIRHVETYYGKDTVIANMVVSHADDDHAAGLVGVIRHFKVNSLWVNLPWRYAAEVIDEFHGNFTVQGLIADMKARHPFLVELEEVATARGTFIREAFQGAQIGNFTVLAPSRARYLKLIPDFDKTPQAYPEKKFEGILGGLFEVAKDAAEKVADYFGYETLDDNPPETSASNESSVVQLGDLAGTSVLLTGDAGPIALSEAADYAELLGRLKSPNFVQVPHHGSRRNVTPAVLDRWLGARLNDGSTTRGTAFVSVGSGEDAKRYPRAKVKNAFRRRGYPVHATRGSTKTHYRGDGRPGWVASVPEAFSAEDDD